MYDRDRVEVGQAIGHISEDAGLVRERYIGVFLHALIQVHVHVLHDETDLVLLDGRSQATCSRPVGHVEESILPRDAN